ncbi:MAG: flagellar type III secretion system pore protein FliP [Oscillospiraceae bacterium]|nr:flagellar type III secretion system pore protein FliP [Oscillospiraceae bacterium]
MKKAIKAACVAAVLAAVLLAAFAAASAQPGITIDGDGVSIGLTDNPSDTATAIQILLIITVISLAPSIIIMMTSFTRIVIVLSFLRNAMGTQQMPPNQVLIGFALFLSLFVMAPVVDRLYDEAYRPFVEQEIDQDQALENAAGVMKSYMLSQFRSESKQELSLFLSLAEIEAPAEPEDLPLSVVIPAFLLNELTIAFKFGFIIFIPFLVIDMVVASTLMSMGMMMLPPVMISLPFKLLLFISIDGWSLLTHELLKTFTMA